jgi:nitroimidazol reductase NimA-like FMN-containing flavoprotein (pyridoxamine 5'-phosphate oxidase superfamily)
MSAPPKVRRVDRVMSAERLEAFVSEGHCGRLATVGADGYPYCIPLLYVWMEGELYVHNTSARGHLRTNIEHDSRVCFEIDQAGEIFDYGRFECDSSIAYASVVVFGRIRVITDRSLKQTFCEHLMAKYRSGLPDRPAGFFPRLDEITVYAIKPERTTGKELALPPVSEQWPAKDNTRTPHARPPAGADQ